jgi:predicted permease
MDKVFLIIGIFTLAMILRRAGMVREKQIGLLVRYVVAISLPCLTLNVIGALDLKHAHFDIAVIAWIVMLAGAALSWAVGRAAGFDGKRLRVFVLVTTFPNTGFLGYPLSYALFGGAGLSYAVLYDQMGMFPVFLSLGFFIAGGMGSILESLKFPPFLALAAALALNVAGFHPSGSIAAVLGGIGWTTLPLTIFLIGAKIRFTALRDARPLVLCLLLRMLVIPLMVVAVLYLMGKSGLPYRVAILESAMSPALTTSILALKYQLDEDLAVACISAGTLICLVMFSVAMVLNWGA